MNFGASRAARVWAHDHTKIRFGEPTSREQQRAPARLDGVAFEVQYHAARERSPVRLGGQLVEGEQRAAPRTTAAQRECQHVLPVLMLTHRACGLKAALRIGDFGRPSPLGCSLPLNSAPFSGLWRVRSAASSLKS